LAAWRASTVVPQAAAILSNVSPDWTVKLLPQADAALAGPVEAKDAVNTTTTKISWEILLAVMRTSLIRSEDMESDHPILYSSFSPTERNAMRR